MPVDDRAMFDTSFKLKLLGISFKNKPAQVIQTLKNLLTIFFKKNNMIENEDNSTSNVYAEVV